MDGERHIPLSVRAAAMSSPEIHAHLTLYLRGDQSLSSALRGAHDALVSRMTSYASAAGLPLPTVSPWPEGTTADTEVNALLRTHALTQLYQREAERQIARSAPTLIVHVPEDSPHK